MQDRHNLIAFSVGFIFGALAAPWVVWKLLEKGI